MDLSLAADIYNISKFYIPQEDHYDLAKDVVRCLTDLGASNTNINKAFSEYDEVIKALDEYTEYTQETDDEMDMDPLEYVKEEMMEDSQETFGGDYYEYLEEDMD